MVQRILDAEQATTGHSQADAVDFLMYHLEGAARETAKTTIAVLRTRQF